MFANSSFKIENKKTRNLNMLFNANKNECQE